MLLLIRSRIVSKRQVICSFAVLICTLPKKLIIQISEFKIKTSGFPKEESRVKLCVSEAPCSQLSFG